MSALIILNNPNEGDKFAYWGECVWAMPSARALAVPVEPIFVVSPADAASIAIARKVAAARLKTRGEELHSRAAALGQDAIALHQKERF